VVTEEVGTAPDAVLIGRLQREYILPAAAPARLDGLGGNLAYAAAAFASWGGQAGLVSRVNAGFPLDRLARLKELGFKLDGIRPVTEPLDSRFLWLMAKGTNPSTKIRSLILRNANCPSRQNCLDINPVKNIAARQIT